MKKQSLTKLFAFILVIGMFSSSPLTSDAQKSGKSDNKTKYCPPCTRWYHGDCVPCRGCCMWLSVILSPNESPDAALSKLPSIKFSLPGSGPVSIKIFDNKGRLIKTLLDENIAFNNRKVGWNRKDEAGNTVSAGIYSIRFDAGVYLDTK